MGSITTAVLVIVRCIPIGMGSDHDDLVRE